MKLPPVPEILVDLFLQPLLYCPSFQQKKERLIAANEPIISYYSWKNTS